MKILIVSDTHRRNENYYKALKQAGTVDIVVHCGDAEGSEYELGEAADCPLKIVLGNNDFFSELPRELTFMAEGKRVWVTHGHNYYVSTGSETLKTEARARSMDIVLYGHTHRPAVDIDKDLVAVNPGSLTYPRQDGKKPSYAVMELDRSGKVDVRIEYI